VVAWQAVLTSILTQTNGLDVTILNNDVNGDTKVDVCDLCVIVNKMKQNDGNVPKSRNIKNQYVCLHIRYEDINKSVNESKETNSFDENEFEEIQMLRVLKNYLERNVKTVDILYISPPLRC